MSPTFVVTASAVVSTAASTTRRAVARRACSTAVLARAQRGNRTPRKSAKPQSGNSLVPLRRAVFGTAPPAVHVGARLRPFVIAEADN